MASLGAKAFVHYDVTIGEGAKLDADSFAMKGEEIFPNGYGAITPQVIGQ